MNYTHRLERVREDVDWLESEIKRLHRRLDEYATLVSEVSGIVGPSDSRVAKEVGDLIDEHYTL